MDTFQNGLREASLRSGCCPDNSETAVQIRRNPHPKNLNFEYTEQFIKDIVFLKSKGVKILLLRLPIYKTLYDLENELVPDFDEKMEHVSQVAGVRYFNLNNDSMRFLTDNTAAYYDASHMVYSSTEAFNKKLCLILKSNGYIKTEIGE